ncbi:hypothetical protein DYB37_001121 [Aphanomyces astaci]|uniref:Fatty acid hydroxylase domain-containing protein n=1 Tax=Aphanomyces astaci TaxID=112090 RepID=A0A397ABH6_APHAT|nr:hypothetical protein DYB36_004661 [Aphanomyces astaci]RHY57418.1 hypothetical protein DYB34_000017 [Aphanomyces astaci]RHY58780.1 hypothetical protein DYB30_009375 [Aphanomyces astaci]RHZ01081.1 hypothetical protein DYB35_007187 [Aphanomyces astaci]RHZ26535.1 hypothetical protein DYB37_001121 [Aphanomyces astaci]
MVSCFQGQHILWLLRRLKFYVIINSFICAVTAAALFVQTRIPHSVVGSYAGILVRLACMIGWFEWISTFKGKIYGAKRMMLTRPQQLSILCHILVVVVPTEMATLFVGSSYVGVTTPTTYTSVLEEFVYFIPKSLVLELVFDLFHFGMHYTCHQIPLLYQYVHKQHHMHLHPSPLSTYEESPVDLILTNVVPMAIALAVGPSLSLHQLHLLLAYKTYVEVAGHSGLDIKGMSFPQMPLVQCVHICIRVHDHDLHHTHPSVNFAKRFSIWDRLFRTYKASTM